MRKCFWGIMAMLIGTIAIAACQSSKGNGETDALENALPDTLVVGTLYSPTSFFLFRGDTLGYEYDRIVSFAKSKHIATRFVIGSNLQSLIEQLDSGAIDIIAYEAPITHE